MKYCSKCGNELLDEAVICPKCGCPVESGTNQNNGSKLNKIKTALVLNIIAFAIAVFTVANYLLLGSSGNSEADQNTKMLLIGLDVYKRQVKSQEIIIALVYQQLVGADFVDRTLAPLHLGTSILKCIFQIFEADLLRRVGLAVLLG